MIPRSNTNLEMESPADPGSKSIPEKQYRPRVWLVDDSEDFRGLLALLLGGENGLNCEREFSSPSSVLAALAEETPPDVILLDIQMGEECGLDAIEPIKTLASSTHIVMLTTCFDSLYQKRALEKGATDFLLKSYSAKQIARRVWQAMKRPIPSVKVEVEVSAGRNGRATKSADNYFSNHVLPARRFVNWRNSPSRILRGAFFVRSLLTMFF